MSQLKAKTYRLLEDRSGQSFLLKVGRKGDLLTFDTELSYNRAIRHAPNEKSPFMDEQSDYAVVTPILFEGGYLETTERQVHTQQFLDLHPDNAANGGSWFELVNDEKEAVDEVRKEDAVLDVKQAIRDKEKEEDGIFALEALTAVLKGSVAGVKEMSKSEMKREIYAAVDENPFRFIDAKGNVTIFEDESVSRKYIVLRAISDGIITVSANNRGVEWSRTKENIVNVPMGMKPVDFLTDFLATNDGMLVLDEIMRRS
jgi:hypothetical protein